MSNKFWIVLGDIHDKIDRIHEIPNLKQAEGVIISGDLTTTGSNTQARIVIDAFKEYNPNIIAQIGNMDRPEVTDWLIENNINLHGQVHELTENIAVFGVGASVFTPFATPSEYPESWFAEILNKTWPNARKYKYAILISHNPPINTVCDRVNDDLHVGSKAVREFIEENQPTLNICGHIHEARGIDRLGMTRVLNPGAFVAGGYAKLYLDDDGVPHVELLALDEN